MIVGIKDFAERLPAKARLLALDHSRTRLGLALGDRATGVATPLDVWHGLKFTEISTRLVGLCKEYGVVGIVLGLPLNMDDSEGPRAQSVRHFALNLDRSGLKIPLTFIDERLSSFDADDRIAGGSAKARDMQDAIAAVVIMEETLRQLS